MRDTFRIVVASITLCLLMSCQSREDKQKWDHRYEFDHYEPRPDHVFHTGDIWQDGNCISGDSIDVCDAQYACDCPDWVSVAALDSPVQSRYYTEHTYYIEPSGTRDPVDSAHNTNMCLRLYGYMDTVRRYPRNAHFQDLDPPKSAVFVYCAYRVIHAGHLPGADRAQDETINMAP